MMKTKLGYTLLFCLLVFSSCKILIDNKKNNSIKISIEKIDYLYNKVINQSYVYQIGDCYKVDSISTSKLIFKSGFYNYNLPSEDSLFLINSMPVIAKEKGNEKLNHSFDCRNYQWTLKYTKPFFEEKKNRGYFIVSFYREEEGFPKEYVCFFKKENKKFEILNVYSND